MNSNVEYSLRCLRWLANAVAKEYQEGNLSAELKTRTEKFYSSISPKFDWHEFTRDDLIRLGFMCYGSEEELNYELWLIPLWLYPVIPEGLLLTDINHNMFTFRRNNAPYEIFYGCMTYGLRMPKVQIREEVPYSYTAEEAVISEIKQDIKYFNNYGMTTIAEKFERDLNFIQSLKEY